MINIDQEQLEVLKSYIIGCVDSQHVEKIVDANIDDIVSIVIREIPIGLTENINDLLAIDNLKSKKFKIMLSYLLRMYGLKEVNIGNELLPVCYYNGHIALNPFMGCNLGCTYCYRTDMGFNIKFPIRIFSDEYIIQLLQENPYYNSKIFISLHTLTTDPFVPNVKESTFQLLKLLQKYNIKNDVIIITKYYLEKNDIEILNTYKNNKIFIFVTYNANSPEIEPLSKISKINDKRWETVKLLKKYAADNIFYAHYYRPIIVGENDDDESIKQSLLFGQDYGMSVLGGLKVDQIKNLPQQTIDKIKRIHLKHKINSVLVLDQSCALTIFNNTIKNSLQSNLEHICLKSPNKCLAMCGEEQLLACKSIPKKPGINAINEYSNKLGILTEHICIQSKHIRIKNISEQTRHYLEFMLDFPVIT